MNELDVVALLKDQPEQRLRAGAVGTIVETLDDASVLVEFTNKQGRPYAIAPCRQSDLLVLRYRPVSE